MPNKSRGVFFGGGSLISGLVYAKTISFATVWFLSTFFCCCLWGWLCGRAPHRHLIGCGFHGVPPSSLLPPPPLLSRRMLPRRLAPEPYLIVSWMLFVCRYPDFYPFGTRKQLFLVLSRIVFPFILYDLCSHAAPFTAFLFSTVREKCSWTSCDVGCCWDLPVCKVCRSSPRVVAVCPSQSTPFFLSFLEITFLLLFVYFVLFVKSWIEIHSSTLKKQKQFPCNSAG